MQFLEGVADWVRTYNETPQSGLGGATPASLWAALERTPVEFAAEAIVRPQESRRVQRWGVQLHNKLYRHDVLAQYDGKDVIVEYDLHNASAVVIRDQAGRFLCDARLVEAKPGMPLERIAQLERKRTKGRIERAQKRIEEIEQQAGLAVTHDKATASLEHAMFGIEEKGKDPSWPAGTDQEEAASGIKLDITSLDW